MQLRKTRQLGCVFDIVTVLFISLWKLRFLHMCWTQHHVLLGVHFKRKCCVFDMYITTAIFNWRQLPTVLRRRVHFAAQRKKRETFHVSKDSSAVCLQNMMKHILMKHVLYICICWFYYISEIISWLLHRRIYRYFLELVQMLGTGPALSRHRHFSTIDQ